ncbi:unnamed protein product [Adineta steineri]|uniref:G-protein coupled receptors family 1 profile domain-containing protein n=1 Tax=Adineta steineri TaxID=433720 RepID=A0A815D3E7_9BILA|nr:unnamed protein product [Adineta steineri]
MIYSNETEIELEAKYLNWLSMTFIRCYCFLMIPLAIIGHSLSIFVFTRRSLRSNPCVMYLRAATIFGLLSACFILPMRLIQSGYIGLDPTVHSIYICKIVWFLLYSIRLLSFWFVVLACIDRYLCSSSSMRKRSWSNAHVASQTIRLTLLIGFLLNIHILIGFNINISPMTNQPICHSGGRPGLYRKISSLFNLIVFGSVPSLCMLFFGSLTLRQIDRKNDFQIIIGTYTKKVRKIRKSERQLTRMLLVQVLIYSTTGLMFTIAFIILAKNSNRQKTIVDTAKENLIIAIVGMLSNTGPCSSFYLFTLSSKRFRKELKRPFRRFVQRQIQIQMSNCNSWATPVDSTIRESNIPKNIL